MNTSALDYAVLRRKPFSVWRIFVWLAPVWAAGIVALPLVFGGRDDPYWRMAMGFLALLGALCVRRRQMGLALYCFIAFVLLCAIAILLPGLTTTG